MSSPETILRKLNFMNRCVKYLKSINPEYVDLESDYEKRSAVERNFQLAIESAIDIGEIIISEEGFERPPDYKSVFLVLGRNRSCRKTLQKNLHPLPALEMYLFTCMKEWTSGFLKNS